MNHIALNHIESERIKYEKVFAFPGYGTKGHGAPVAPLFFQRSKPSLMADFGCARGASLKPYLDAGYEVIPIDHCDVLDETIRKNPNVLPLVKANLWADNLPKVSYGICTDVMEHIPEEYVSRVIENISKSVQHGCLWTICHVKDVWGYKIQDTLHLTIKPRTWWTQELNKYWPVVEILSDKGENTTYWTEH